MDSPPPGAAVTEEQYLKNKLQWLMFLRVIVALFFLGLAAAMHMQQTDSYLARELLCLYGLAGGICGLTVAYVGLLRVAGCCDSIALGQIVIDLLLVTLLLYITGGINSIFSFLYSIVIIAASICLYFKGGLIAATLAGMLYAALLVLQHVGMISPLQLTSIPATGYSDESIYFPIIVNVSAFYLMAVLSSFLAEQARKSRLQLQEKQTDIETLGLLHEHIVQNIPSGLMTLDQRGRIITFNSAAESITGYTAASVLHRPLQELFPELHAVVTDGGRRHGAEEQIRREVTCVRRDGTRIHLGALFSALKDASGRQQGTILIFEDLTQYHAMQEHIKRTDRLAAVGRLAAGIAHEIRNPLASISGSIQVLKRSLTLSEADARLMDIILRESNNLNMLISDFVQFARPGTEKPPAQPLRLKLLVDEVVAMLKNSPECPGSLVISEQIPEDLTLRINAQQCKQVLWNLMLNAAQALPPQGGRIVVSASAKENGIPLSGETLQGTGQQWERPHDTARWVEMRVEDSGCGIPEEVRDAIFDPFFTTKDNGTGLGLSIVHKIVEEYGGTILVESTPGRGTTFTLYLPA